MVLTADVLRVAQDISDSPVGDLATSFAAGIQSLLPDSCLAASNARLGSEIFSTVIYSRRDGSQLDRQEIPAAAAAVVFHVADCIDLEELRSAYHRLAAAKRGSSPLDKGSEFVEAAATATIVYARSSIISLDALAKELRALNLQYESKFWVDHITVASLGVITYSVQFAGADKIQGEFLPPARNALSGYRPAIYIHMAIGPTQRGFCRLAMFIFGAVTFFLSKSGIHFNKDELLGDRRKALLICGYMFNAAGNLTEAPSEFYANRSLPSAPMRIERVADGEHLAAIKFVPWIDGGAILIRGTFPIEMALVNLQVGFSPAGIIKEPNGLQLSPVLPITQNDFAGMLGRLQARVKEIAVKKDTGTWVIQTVANEGTSSQFVARLLLGVLRLRDVVYSDDSASRERFDQQYEIVTLSLTEARKALARINEIWNEHTRKVADGTIARLVADIIQIDESVDQEIQSRFDTFVMLSVRAIKTGMQGACSVLGEDIGFLFQRTPAFETKIAEVETRDALLATYLRNARLWTEPLVNVRNDAEHNGWFLPRTRYSWSNGQVRWSEPSVTGEPFTAYANLTYSRVCGLVEGLAIHLLQQRLPAEFEFIEIAREERDHAAPERFQVAIKDPSVPGWRLQPDARPFEES